MISPRDRPPLFEYPFVNALTAAFVPIAKAAFVFLLILFSKENAKMIKNLFTTEYFCDTISLGNIAVGEPVP